MYNAFINFKTDFPLADYHQSMGSQAAVVLALILGVGFVSVPTGLVGSALEDSWIEASEEATEAYGPRESSNDAPEQSHYSKTKVDDETHSDDAESDTGSWFDDSAAIARDAQAHDESHDVSRIVAAQKALDHEVLDPALGKNTIWRNSRWGNIQLAKMGADHTMRSFTSHGLIMRSCSLRTASRNIE